MTDLELQLRRQMGDFKFELRYKRTFMCFMQDGSGGYPCHDVVLHTLQAVELMLQGTKPTYDPRNEPNVPIPELDSIRIFRCACG